MARARDLTGARYGKLRVIASEGYAVYGGRRGLLWRCRCDCGEEIPLHVAKLPYSEANVRAAETAGRLVYTCCETCRQKTCQVCGDRFSYSHVSHICPNPACQQENQRERDAIWHARALERYRTDPDFRRRWREYHDEYYRRHSVEIQEARRQKLERMTPEEREQYEQREYKRRAAYYRDMKSDPERYARHMERHRERLADQAAREFFGTAQEIINIIESDTDE